MQMASYYKTCIDLYRKEKASHKARKIKQIQKWKEVEEQEKKRALELKISLKQTRADERYEAHMNFIRNKAKVENGKTNEVSFLNEMKNEERKMTLDMKIQQTRDRRQKVLDEVKRKQLERS